MRIIGAQSIPNGIADLIGRSNIHLSSPVASIDNGKKHVTVTTTDGRAFTAKKCIVSLPTTLYRDINISPPLPPALSSITDNTILGHYNKAIVAYDRPWWRDLGYNGFVMSYKGPVVVARDTSVDEKRFFALTCFVNGAHGEAWGRMHQHERRRVVLRQLAQLYRKPDDGAVSDEVYKPIEFFEQIWKHEPYSKGALAPITALGDYAREDSPYGRPVGNLHFVGTEFSREWKGYMEGALWSGEKGAAEVVDSLGQKKPAAKL